jgi:hypothetical protein
MKPMIPCRMTLAALAAFAAVGSSFATDVSKTKTPVVSSNLTGLVRSALLQTKSSFQVKFKGLPASATNSLYLDDLPVADVVSDTGGKSKLKFATPRIGTALLLNFDPRGKTVRVHDGMADLLAVVHSGPGEPAGVASLEQTDLLPAAAAGTGATAIARYKQSSSGRASFRIKLTRTVAGDYTLYVDGLPRAAFAVPATGAATVQFDSLPTPPKLPLDFDPRGKRIDIFPGAAMAYTNAVAFTGPLIARIPNISACNVKLQEAELAAKPPAGSGTAAARFQTHGNCQRDFHVEIQNVTAGDYDLYVGDVLRGTISAAGSSGEITFSTELEGPDILPLTFDVQGPKIEVRQSSTVFFSGKITGQPSHPPCDLTDDEVALINTGADTDARGDARLRQNTDCSTEFRVRVRDLPAGDYILRVDGADQGTITVSAVGGEFQGEATVDVNARGKLVEVVQGATVYLARVFPP